MEMHHVGNKNRRQEYFSIHNGLGQKGVFRWKCHTERPKIINS